MFREEVRHYKLDFAQGVLDACGTFLAKAELVAKDPTWWFRRPSGQDAVTAYPFAERGPGEL